MDEAEYCARIGLMVDGELTALDTPDALKKQYVPGTTVAFEGRDMQRAAKAMRDAPFVRAADLFGASLHVRFDERATSAQEIERALRNAGGVPERSEQVEASLEDVFLAVVGRTAKSTEAA
jgi:ABC-2 type transport system ATP-binding protein